MLRLTSDLNGTLRVPDEKTELTKNPSLCQLPCLALPISVDQSAYIIRVNPEVDPERIPGTVYTKDEVLTLICGQQRKDVVDKTGEASRVGNILHDKTYFIDGANFFRWEEYNGKGRPWSDWEFLHPDYETKSKTNRTAWRRIVKNRGTHPGTEHQRIVAVNESHAAKRAAMGDGDVIIVISGVAFDNQFKKRWREVARVLLSFVKEEGHVNIIVTRPRECKQKNGKGFGFDRMTEEGFKEEDGIPRNVPCHAIKRIPAVGDARRPDSKCVFYLIGNLDESNDGAAVHNVGIETAKDGTADKKKADGSKIYKREGEHRLCEYDDLFLLYLWDEARKRGGNATKWPGSTSLGSKWVKIGPTPPSSGNLIVNSQLAHALTTKLKFTKQELVVFGIKSVHADDYIRSGKSYFIPDMTVVANESHGLRWRKIPNKPPSGRAIPNERLAQELMGKVDDKEITFTKQELKGFGLDYVHPDDFVRTNASYFKQDRFVPNDFMTFDDNLFTASRKLGSNEKEAQEQRKLDAEANDALERLAQLRALEMSIMRYSRTRLTELAFFPAAH